MSSILDEMTGAIGARKAAAASAAGLTAVGTERKAPLDMKAEVAFPHDDPAMAQSAVLSGLREVATLRQHLDFLERGLTALADLYGAVEGSSVEPVTKDAVRFQSPDDTERAAIQAVEREEKATFDQEYARKQAEAQEATYAAPPAEVGSVLTGWTCPEHKQASDIISPKGRHYRKCPQCGAFER